MPDISGRGRGDELVEVVVETPRHLTPRQEELLREFAEIEHVQVSPRRKSFFEKLRDYFTEETETPEIARTPDPQHPDRFPRWRPGPSSATRGES